MTAAGSTTYAWDAANRLKTVNGGSLGSYGYDGNGKRVKKSESGTTTYYVISSVLGSALEVTSAGVQRAYVMNGGAVVAQLNPNGQFYWLHLDHLGSGRKMTDTGGNMTYRAEFDPYGKLLYEWSSPTNLNTRKFTGYERDAATGLDYAQARMYSSDWGRFISPDPVGLKSADLKKPKSLNRYAYVQNNPINAVDPSGEFILTGTESNEWLCRLGLSAYCNSFGYFWEQFRPPTKQDLIDSGDYQRKGNAAGRKIPLSGKRLTEFTAAKKKAADFFKGLASTDECYQFLQSNGIAMSSVIKHIEGQKGYSSTSTITAGDAGIADNNNPLKELTVKELFEEWKKIGQDAYAITAIWEESLRDEVYYNISDVITAFTVFHEALHSTTLQDEGRLGQTLRVGPSASRNAIDDRLMFKGCDPDK